MSIIGFIAGLFSDETHRQNMEMMQQMADMQNMEVVRQINDPYMTPGLDAGIDEAYHGIDHGMGIANPEQTFERIDDGFFGSSSDDSFFGSGSDDSSFGGGLWGDDFF